MVVVTKKEKAEGSTNYAQGFIVSVFDQDDSFDLHIKDTLKSGDGLCHEAIVRVVVETRFGVFVDVGVHQVGLVHISQMADRFS